MHCAARPYNPVSGPALGVTLSALSELVNGRRGISPKMAIRLYQVFGGSADSWITQKAQYKLAQIPVGRIQLKRLTVAYRSTMILPRFDSPELATAVM